MARGVAESSSGETECSVGYRQHLEMAWLGVEGWMRARGWWQDGLQWPVSLQLSLSAPRTLRSHLVISSVTQGLSRERWQKTGRKRERLRERLMEEKGEGAHRPTQSLGERV